MNPGRFTTPVLLSMCLAALWAAISAFNAAQATVRVTAAQTHVDLQSEAVYLRDERGNMSLADVRELDAGHWRAVTDKKINFGFDTAAYWFKLDLRFSRAKEWLLEIGYPLLDHIEVYGVTFDQLVFEATTGDGVPFHQRPVSHRNFLFPQDVRPGQTLELYIRVQTVGAFYLPLTLWQKDAFIQQEENVVALHGIYFGLMLVMLLYNFFIFLVLRDTGYLWYIGVVATTLLFQAALHGFAYQYLWPNAVWWHGQSMAVFTSWATTFSMFFARDFLKMKKRGDWLARSLKWLSYFALAIAVLSFFIPYVIGIRLSLILGLLVPIAIIVAGVTRWLEGSIAARYFTVAWALFAVATAILVLTKADVLPSNFFTENAQQIGSALEVVLLSLALAQRIAEERLKRYKAQARALESERQAREAQEHALQTQKAANEELEQRVKERTHELESTMERLSEANTLLRNLSALDGLTGVHNRRAFDERFDLEWKRARRTQTSISLLLIDIDHFKRLNDTYGHLAGDECLKMTATAIAETIRRPADFCARYGGEEFVIILPETFLDGAIHMAEQIRRRTEALDVRFNEHSLSLTASIGCATIVPEGDIEPHELVARADKALYLAKDHGRNRVEPYRAEQNGKA